MENLLKLQSEFSALGLHAKFNEPMSLHTTIRCGGNALIYIEPDNFEKLKKAVKILKEYAVEFVIIGNGSNILFKDGGYNGAVICLNSKYSEHRIFNDRLYADCGMPLKKISNVLKGNGLTGFEFADAIPAVLGGAVYMNAGAYGSSFSDIVESVLVYDYELNDCKLKNKNECGFSYRHSIFQQNNEIILGAVLKLKKGEKEEISRKITEYNALRKKTQPVDYPSMGSVFKRGKDYFPAKLIEDCGLKGLNIGGAEVSTLHSGFIINKGSASAENILNLIDTIKLKVYNVYKVELIEEIKVLGED